MNRIKNNFLLAGYKFMPEMYLLIVLADYLIKTKREFKKLKKQDIQDIFIKTNKIQLVFNMTWLMDILKIYLEEQPLIEYYVIRHLILLNIQNKMDIKEV